MPFVVVQFHLKDYQTAANVLEVLDELFEMDQQQASVQQAGQPGSSFKTPFTPKTVNMEYSNPVK